MNLIFAIIGSTLIFAIIGLYVLLVLGFPLGEYAMGGKYKVLPKKLKITCSVTIVILIIMIVTLLQANQVINIGWPYKVTKVLCYIFAIYLTLNTVMNLLSFSKKEKLVMTPLALVSATCFWLTIFTSQIS